MIIETSVTAQCDGIKERRLRWEWLLIVERGSTAENTIGFLLLYTIMRTARSLT